MKAEFRLLAENSRKQAINLVSQAAAFVQSACVLSCCTPTSSKLEEMGTNLRSTTLPCAMHDIFKDMFIINKTSTDQYSSYFKCVRELNIIETFTPETSLLIKWPVQMAFRLTQNKT